MRIPYDIKKHFLGKAYSLHTGFFWGSVKYPLDENVIESSDKIAVCVADKESKSSYLVFDIDGNEKKKDETKEILSTVFENLQSLDINPTVFTSGKKGYHVYVFLSSPLAIHALKVFGQSFVQNIDVPKSIDIEVFPKQSSVNYDGQRYGNHLKMPLSIHPGNEKPSEQLTEYSENSPLSITKHLEIKDHEIDRDTLIALFTPYFSDGKRHNNALAIAGYFRQNDFPKEYTREFLLDLCTLVDGDEYDFESVVESTYTAKAVKGLQLADNFDEKIIASIQFFVVNSKFVSLKKEVMNIRNEKGLNHVKVEMAMEAVYAYLSTNYTLFNDGVFIYAINNDEKISDNNESLNIFLTSNGINVAENFGRQVRNALVTKVLVQSERTEVHNFSSFDGEILTIYGKQNIVVNEAGIETNAKLYPVLHESNFRYIEDEKPNAIDAVLDMWDLSKEDKDLIVTWIVYQFFIDRMNTKPILILKGTPGSGKTTLAKFILQVIENRESFPIASNDLNKNIQTLVANHKCLAVDNLEFMNAQTTDLINSITTGTVIEMRKLYTTNNVYRIKPKTSFLITSAYNAFDHDGALSSRTIEVSLSNRVNFMSDSAVESTLSLVYDAFKSEILKICRGVLLVDSQEEGEHKTRLGDYIDLSKKINYVTTDVQSYVEQQQLEKKKSNVIYLIFMDALSGTEYTKGKPFQLNDIVMKMLTKARAYKVDITLSNLGMKLLSTGLFERKGKYYSLIMN